MKCNNCGKEIIKVADRWYHIKNQLWYCNTKKAEPFKGDDKDEI